MYYYHIIRKKFSRSRLSLALISHTDAHVPFTFAFACLLSQTTYKYFVFISTGVISRSRVGRPFLFIVARVCRDVASNDEKYYIFFLALLSEMKVYCHGPACLTYVCVFYFFILLAIKIFSLTFISILLNAAASKFPSSALC
jgi:hypothetical protein